MGSRLEAYFCRELIPLVGAPPYSYAHTRADHWRRPYLGRSSTIMFDLRLIYGLCDCHDYVPGASKLGS